MRVAVVTPYCTEPLEVLRRCHESVLAQAHPCTHIMVADGAPSAEAAGWDARHIVLPEAHADGGSTPRAAGALSAFNSGFDAVAFLDADNWYAPGHVRTAVEAARAHGAAVVCADRRIVLPGGEECPFEDRDVAERRHVDTSCFFITREAAFLIGILAMLGPTFGTACDRIMLEAVRQKGCACAWTGERTVYYTSRWGLHYKALGLAPPADEHCFDWQRVGRACATGELTARLGPGYVMDHLFESEHAVTDEPADAFWSRLVPAP